MYSEVWLWNSCQVLRLNFEQLFHFFCMWLLDNVLIMFRRFIRWNFNLSNLNHLKVSNVLMMIQEFKHGPSPRHPYPVLWPQFGRVLDIHYTIKYSLYILIYMSNMLKLEFEILLKYILCCKSQFAWVSKLCLSPRSLFIHGFYQFNQGHLRSTSGLVLKQAFEQNQNLWDWWLYIDFNIYIYSYCSNHTLSTYFWKYIFSKRNMDIGP